MLNLKFLSMHNISSESNKFVFYITYEKRDGFSGFFLFCSFVCFICFLFVRFAFVLVFFVDYHFHF